MQKTVAHNRSRRHAIAPHCLFLMLVVVAFVSCNKDAGQNPTPYHTRNIIDTAYGAAPLQKMDLYLPAGRGKTTRTVVLIHGGGWSEGDKSELSSGIPTMQALLPGYAFANINYRLAFNGTTNVFPTQENDIIAAVRFLVNNSKTFGLSDEMILAGFSAGAHLALLHAYKNDAEGKVKAVVDFFGPTQLELLWNIGPVQQLILRNAVGKTLSDNPEIYKVSSPLNFVTESAPPTIILQGGLDPLVVPAQSEILVNVLETKGILNEFVFYPTEMHGWNGSQLQHSLEKVKAFIEKIP